MLKNPANEKAATGKYLLRLVVIAPDGNALFSGEFVAEKEDMIEPDRVTPGLSPIADFLTRTAKEL